MTSGTPTGGPPTGGTPTGELPTDAAADGPPGGRPGTAEQPPGSSGNGPVQRTRVVLAHARPPATAGADAALSAQTPVGAALIRGLVRAQLALAVRMALVVAAGLGALPLLFVVAPDVGEAKVAGVNLPWLLLGVAAFPFLVGVGLAYVRLAERNEQDFAAVVARERDR
jgi:hypothetical protein